MWSEKVFEPSARRTLTFLKVQTSFLTPNFINRSQHLDSYSICTIKLLQLLCNSTAAAWHVLTRWPYYLWVKKEARQEELAQRTRVFLDPPWAEMVLHLQEPWAKFKPCISSSSHQHSVCAGLLPNLTWC